MEFPSKKQVLASAPKNEKEWIERICNKFCMWCETGYGNEFWSYLPTEHHAAFTTAHSAKMSEKSYGITYSPNIITITST